MNLKGLVKPPKSIDDNIDNSKLTSLDNPPQKIGGNLDISKIVDNIGKLRGIEDISKSKNKKGP